MEILAQELAKLLNITVDKAVELYPLLRDQFILYKILLIISRVFTFAGILAFIFLIVGGIASWVVIDFGDDIPLEVKKILKISSITLAVVILCSSGISIVQYTLLPDFMIIKEFLIK